MAGNSVKIRIDGDASGFEKNLSNLTSRTKAGLADIKAGFDMAAAAAKKLFEVGSKGVNYNATIESLKTSFEVMTGSAEKAADVVDRLRVMGAETPFEMIDLASTTQLLMQYGFTADEAIDRMRMLGDIAQGNAQNMNSIALGYAQMSSAGKVNLVDIKQMINAGFNPLQEISERTGESMESLYERISDGTMTVDEITQSMIHATSEGGRFFQSMEKQSQTLNGQLSTLKDNADQLLGSLTEGMSDKLRDEIIPLANNMMAELQGALDSGGYEGLLTKATEMLPGLIDMLTGELQSGIEGLTKWLPKGAKELMKAVPSALKAAAGVTPQIVTALFEVSSLILSDLLVMLPELIPVFLDGLLNTFNAAAEGLFKGIANIFTGIEQAMHEGQTKIAGMWVDEEGVKKISAVIDGEFDTSDLDEEEAQLKQRIQTLYENIQAVLTDGQPDTEEVMAPLSEEVDAVVAELDEGVDAWEKAEIEKLDPTAENFTQACDNIRTQANLTKMEINGYAEEIKTFLDDMAGKSAEYVLSQIGRIDEATAALQAAAEKYGKAVQEMSPEAIAYKAVRAGASTDENTIGLALDYAIASYRLDEQSLTDSYNALIDDINQRYANGEITENESLELQADAKLKYETDKEENKREYEKMLGEVFTGIAGAEGSLPAIEGAAAKLGLSEALEELGESLVNETGVVGDKLGEDITNMLAEHMGIDPEILKNMPVDTVEGAIDSWAADLFFEAQTAIENTDNTKVQQAYKAALESGILEGTSFDTENAAEQFSAMIASIATDGAEKAKPEAKAAGEAVAGSANEAMAETGDDGETRGEEFGDGYAEGILSKYWKVYNASKLLAQASSAGTADGQESNSPSKVAAGLGRDFGDGYSLGLQQSMAKAALIARRMTGGISTAADISQNMRVNIPDLSQEIILANEQSQQPVNLFINGKELARVTASDNQTAASWYDRRLAIGRGR